MPVHSHRVLQTELSGARNHHYQSAERDDDACEMKEWYFRKSAICRDSLRCSSDQFSTRLMVTSSVRASTSEPASNVDVVCVGPPRSVIRLSSNHTPTAAFPEAQVLIVLRDVGVVLLNGGMPSNTRGRFNRKLNLDNAIASTTGCCYFCCFSQ